MSQKRNAVTCSTGIQCMLSSIYSEFLRFADDREVFCRKRAVQKRLLFSVLKEYGSRGRLGDVLTYVDPSEFGIVVIELTCAYLLAVLLEVRGLSIDLKRQIPGHKDERFEAFVDAAKESTGRGIATVTDECQPLRVNVFACQQKVRAAAKVYVLLHLNSNLLHVKRRIVRRETRMNRHVVRQKRHDAGLGENNGFFQELGAIPLVRAGHTPVPINHSRKGTMTGRNHEIGSYRPAIRAHKGAAVVHWTLIRDVVDGNTTAPLNSALLHIQGSAGVVLPVV